MWSSYQKFIINMEDGRSHPYPRAPAKGDKTYACSVSGQAHMHAKTLFATFPEDFKTNSSCLCRNIEEFPYKLWICPRLCSLSSGVDNIHKCLPGFIIHFHLCNLRIFPLRCLQQQLIVLLPG